jgi:hypothetical protein
VILRFALGALLLASGAVGAAAQDTVHFRDPGPQGAPEPLVRALAGSYIVIRPTDPRALIARGARFSCSAAMPSSKGRFTAM